jgi:hypothetical protein
LLLALLTALIAGPVRAERRALVIGNRVYATTDRFPKLATTVNDAKVMDCCREVPDQSWLASENLKRGFRGDVPPALAPPPNILIGFATSSGRSTNDTLQEGDANGPLVNALRTHWNDGLEWDPLWKAVATDVYKASLSTAQKGTAGEIQMPSKYGQTIYDFYFTPPRPGKAPAASDPKMDVARLEPVKPAVPALPYVPPKSWPTSGPTPEAPGRSHRT